MDRERLAAALAYEQQKRRRLAETVPGLVTTPAQLAPRADFRTNLENLSIGLGEGLTNQLEGIKGVVTDPVGTAKGTYEAVKGVVRDPSVIADALRQMGSKAMSGPLGAGEVIGEMIGPMRGKTPMAELDVYHGTPHRFPATEANPLGEFDASKIGTGEGAQVYGRGIYFTESPQAATQYKERLSSSKPSQASFIRMRDQEQVGSEVWNYYNELARQRESSLYKADLPDEMIDRMLNYDKPINEQNQFVLDALEKAGINTQSAMRAGQMIQGQEAHLAKFGIPGIIYREQGGPRNFVVFPGEEKKVRILERK